MSENKKLNVTINSIKKSFYDGQADIVIIKTPSGDIGVMANHTPILTLLSNSHIKIKHDKKEFFFDIKDGIAQVFDNRLTIMDFSW